MITHSYKKLFKKLDKSKLNEIQTIQNPIVSVNLADGSSTITIGGDLCFIHYNRQKEIDHSTQKMQKRFRTLKRQEKNARCYNLGDELPNVTFLNREGDNT